MKAQGLHKNWMAGRYHPIPSRCHLKRVTGVAANQNSILSAGKDGFIYMYSRDFFFNYKLINIEAEILCMHVIKGSMVCFVDCTGNGFTLLITESFLVHIHLILLFPGFFHVVDVPPKLPSSSNEPPASKFWTSPIGDYDTKTMLVTEMEQLSTDAVETLLKCRDGSELLSFLVVFISHHYTASVLRVVLNGQSLSDERWPLLNHIRSIALVSKFEIASDDTEEVLTFSLPQLSSADKLDNDKLVFVSSYECPVSIYHLMTGVALLKLSTVFDIIYSAKFNPQTCSFYSGGADGRVIVWTVGTSPVGSTGHLLPLKRYFFHISPFANENLSLMKNEMAFNTDSDNNYSTFLACVLFRDD